MFRREHEGEVLFNSPGEEDGKRWGGRGGKGNGGSGGEERRGEALGGRTAKRLGRKGEGDGKTLESGEEGTEGEGRREEERKGWERKGGK